MNKTKFNGSTTSVAALPHWKISGLALLLGFMAAGWCRAETNKWEADIAAFEAADKTNPPPKDAILFVGSSSIRLWKTLARDFSEFPVINRGFGGSEMADSVTFAERIVLPYRPRQIMVYAGDNDIAAGKSGEKVAADFKAFVKKVHKALPETRIAYIAIKPSPSRWRLVDKINTANGLIAKFTKTDKRLTFIDVFTPMLGADGRPRPELFQPDQLHLNAQGYELWTQTVRPFLK